MNINNALIWDNIDWNEINSEDGKRLMKEKIDNFINVKESCMK